MSICLALFTLCLLTIDCLARSEPIHIPIYRRGGRLAQHEDANLTRFSELLTASEQRYLRTSREVMKNKLVRKWHGSKSAESNMLDEVGLEGTWYAKIQVGSSLQELELDLDMLIPDLYTVMTTSGQGSKYDTFLSGSFESSNDLLHPDCRNPSDVFHFTHHALSKSQMRFKFPTCQASKSTRHTLFKSGSKLGLGAPQPLSLSHLSSNIVEQLWQQHEINHKIVSVTLLSADAGVLSIGGTLAPHMERLKIETEVHLNHIGDTMSDAAKVEQEIRDRLNFAIPPGSTHNELFKWSDAGSHASAGWHMTLLDGIWIAGVRVLKNQPALLDINCPFILAPPMAAESLYECISGAMSVRDLDVTQNELNTEGFYTFPCLHNVNIAFEIGGWQFPVARGVGLTEDIVHGPVGGLFSLGKVNATTADQLRADTGYCVGIVVETQMGMRDGYQHAGMNNVWVLGQPFFRATGVTFDFGDEKGHGQRVGLRTY